MSLIPRSSLFDIDRFFGDPWTPAEAERTQTNTFFAPRVDIKEAAGHYEITAELPGVTKDDIQVHVRDGLLTLEAESNQANTEEEDGKVIRQERRYGKFMRTFNLGSEVQEEDIQASFQDGVLTLKAPKVVEEEALPRRITIQ